MRNKFFEIILKMALVLIKNTFEGFIRVSEGFPPRRVHNVPISFWDFQKVDNVILPITNITNPLPFGKFECDQWRIYGGGANGGNCPPFTMKTKLWRPLFGKKSAPYPDPNALFFQCFVLNAGKQVN